MGSLDGRAGRTRIALRNVLIGAVVAGTVLSLVETQMAGGHAVRRMAICQSNARQTGVALFMYAADYDGRLPASAGSFAGLVDSTRPYLRDNVRYRCPDMEAAIPANKGGFRVPPLYAGLSILGGWPDPYLGGRIAEPWSTILLFESDTDQGTAIVPAYRHSGGAVCLGLTGQSQWVRDLRAAR